MSEINYYSLFTIPRTASATDIKARYRKLSLKYHPDSGGSTEQMILLNKAYSILSNPLLRREYDQRHPLQPQSHTNTSHARDDDFIRTRPTYYHADQTEPIRKAQQDPSMWRHAPQPARDTKRRSHFWRWFSFVAVLVVGFIGYQTFALAQPAQFATTTPTATSYNPTNTVSSSNLGTTTSSGSELSAAQAEALATSSTDTPTAAATPTTTPSTTASSSTAPTTPKTTSNTTTRYQRHRTNPTSLY